MRSQIEANAFNLGIFPLLLKNSVHAAFIVKKDLKAIALLLHIRYTLYSQYSPVPYFMSQMRSNGNDDR